MAKNREISSCVTGTFKKGVRIPRIYLASALALCAVGLASAGDVVWQPQNGSTDISDPRNWAGGVLPGNGDLKKFGNGNLHWNIVAGDGRPRCDLVWKCCASRHGGRPYLQH